MEKKNFIWNSAGSFCNAISSVIMLAIVSRFCNEDETGIYSLGWSISQLASMIGAYGVRTYHATDIKREYLFHDYFLSRIISCMLMILYSILYVLLKGYSSYKIKIILLICAFKMLDDFADVYHGEFQRNGKLYYGGKAMVMRYIFSTIAFFLFIRFRSSLMAGLFAVCFVSFFILFTYENRYIREFNVKYMGGNAKESFKILKICFPLFLTAFLQMYLLNLPKNAIDRYMPEKYQGYYNMISMPASIMYLLGNFIYRPLLLPLAELWNSGKSKMLYRIIIKIVAVNLLLFLLAELAMFIVGEPIMSYIYNVNLDVYKRALLIIIGAGVLESLCSFAIYILTIQRKQGLIGLVYCLSAVDSFFLTDKLVNVHGINGAAFSFLVNMLLTLVLLVIFVLLSEGEKKGNIKI